MKFLVYFIFFFLFSHRLICQNLIRNGDFEIALRDSSNVNFLDFNQDISNYTPYWKSLFKGAGPFYSNKNSYSEFRSALAGSNYKNFKCFRNNGMILSQYFFDNKRVGDTVINLSPPILNYNKNYLGSSSNKHYLEWGFFQQLQTALKKDSFYTISYRYKMGLNSNPDTFDYLGGAYFSYRQVYSHFGILFSENPLITGNADYRRDTNEMFPNYKKELQDTVFNISYKWRLVERTFQSDSAYLFVNFARFQHQDSAKYFLDTFQFAYFFNQIDNIRLLPLWQYLSVSPDTSVCMGDSITLKVLSGVGAYSWRNIKNPNIILSTNPTLKIKVTDTESMFEVMSPYDTATIMVYVDIDKNFYDTINYLSCQNQPLKISPPNINNWYDNTKDTTKTFTQSGSYWYQTKSQCNYKRTQLNIQISNDKFDTLKLTSCDSFQWQNQIYKSSGVYTKKFLTSLGCDSSKSLNLILNQSQKKSFNQFSCSPIFWNDSTYTKSGTYIQRFKALNQCDSIVSLDLKIGLDNRVSLVNGTNYTALQDSVSYQWYRCYPWRRIPNETNKTFTTLTKGSYAVVLDNGKGCRDTSDCIALYSSSLLPSTSSKMRIYPNPFRNDITIDLDRQHRNIQIKIYDLTGRMIQINEYQKLSTVNFQLSNLTTGTYYLQVETESETQFFNIYKE